MVARVLPACDSAERLNFLDCPTIGRRSILFSFVLFPLKGHGQRAMVLFTVATWLNPCVGQPSEGSIMKRLFASAFLLLGSVGVTQAQVSAPTLNIDRGNVAQEFSAIFANEHVKITTYGAGPKIARRQKQWEPWLHAIFGGAHEQPQVIGQGRNSYAIKAGGGGDYRWNPRISFRLEGDYVRTGFFSQSQNSFQIAGGVVFHF